MPHAAQGRPHSDGDPREVPSESELEAIAGRRSVPRGGDRRRSRTPRLSRFSIAGGRREAPRRTSEREGSFVDVYDANFLLALMWVALANVADSFFTLIHLQNGGSEVNPVADLLLRTGLTEFVLFKSALVALALLVLCLHKNFKVARVGLWAAAGAYTLLIVYHLALFLA